jgi:hypothetical protein
MRPCFVQDRGNQRECGLTAKALAATVQLMTDNRLSGVALIAGSVGSIITMSLHPSGQIAPAQMEAMIRMLIGVHALALTMVPVLFLGAWGLSRRGARIDRMDMAGLVLYTFALLAIANAAVADGLVTPNILRQMVASAGAPAAIDGWRMVSRYNFYVNQGYAQVFVAASSVAIGLWSIAMLRKRDLSQGLGIYGCILGAATLLALFSGHLRLDTHGFGAVMFAQAAWFILAGTLLWRSEKQAAATV